MTGDDRPPAAPGAQRAVPYTKLSPGHHATLHTEAGLFTLEIVSIDEYGLTGYVVSDEGGFETDVATMVPWASIALLTWPVVV